MVKSLRVIAHSFKWLLLLAMLVVIGLAIWLHQGERSLSFAKPWIEKAINNPEAPYVATVGDVSINWTDVTLLGKLHIHNITFAKRDGNVFAQFPELYATVDPLGFLPSRRLLHKVILRQPHLYMARNAEGIMEFGIEDSPARMPLADLLAFIGSSSSETPTGATTLPFRDFIIDRASLVFKDETTGTDIVSSPFEFRLRRKGKSYDAQLAMPFTVDEQPVNFGANFITMPGTRQHLLALELKQFPSRLLCLFDTCSQGVSVKGLLNGTVGVHVADDLSLHSFKAILTTPKAVLTMPKWFAEPLKLAESSITLEGDWSKQQFALAESTLKLEDTTLTASGKAEHKEDGWYISGEGGANKLAINKLYKYWPLAVAPESRDWITNKLKSGFGENAKLKFSFTPADLAAPVFPEKSISATLDARDITFEYLPGFPLVEKMNGKANFTAVSVKVEGSGGSLMSGTKINRAILWCPELNSDHNPMETTLDLSTPASDVVGLLALKHFTFDDKLGLDAKTIQGNIDAQLKLKFNAFSGNESKDPNEIHFDAVDYDISTTFKDIAQNKIAGSYDVRALNGTLKADANGMNFDGSLGLGESVINDIKLSQPSGKPLKLDVKGRPGKEKNPANDFNLTYVAGDVPNLTLRGKRLDASVSYGKSENSILADFPAIKLDIDLGQLMLAGDAPFSDVHGTLHCTKARCESANFSAKTEKGDVKGSISKVNGQRQFLVTATNAGDFLKALDITDRMTKGRFEMTGTYDDGKAPSQLNARLLITEFNLKNSQILGRILTVGSLTGVANMLTGSGIAFEKLSANITSRGGLITVDKGMANGAAIGITIGGTVDTTNDKLKLGGVVAPAYALNSIFSKIPIIGLLAGGEGEGLIAFNYWVGGTYDDPDVGVNPLSGLTPGFLRGIFGNFDGKQAGDDESTVPQDNRPVGERMKEQSRPRTKQKTTKNQ